MDCIDRRHLLTLVVGAAAAATIGSGLNVPVAEAGPLPRGEGWSEDSEDLVQPAQSGPPPRRGRPWRGRGFGPRRHWVCWSSRGRRVCGWRRW
jgi:hypothetical protein